ncbi:MAG TPA: nuclear transport factor 2 family protein [Rhodanobacteraceae bacterium]|nr:nuclear transport factor 2 family protein [Rhodanobacteraceae bacterium]
MKRIAWIFPALASFAACAMPPASSDEQAIRRVEATLCDAIRTGDADTIARLEDETYTLTTSRGEVTTRADDIADARKGDVRYSEFRNHDSKVRLYGDAAIVTGITSLKGESAGKSFALDVAFTDTYVRRPDGWKIAASHASRLGKQ